MHTNIVTPPLVGSPNPAFPFRGTPESAPAGPSKTLEYPLEHRRAPPPSPERSSARKCVPKEVFGSGLESPGAFGNL